jgi:hypothetical protein
MLTVLGGLAEVRYVTEELTDPYSLFAGGIGVAGFEDLLIRTLLEGTIHNYTERLAVRRAMEFMHDNVFQALTV